MALTNKYVSPSGSASWANADNVAGDDTGRASFATMLTDAVAGDKIHLMPDDGASKTFSRTTNDDSFTADGTDTSPIIICGADANGDELSLDPATRRTLNGAGPIDTTDMPLVDYTTGKFNTPATCLVRNIFLDSDGSTASGTVYTNEIEANLYLCVARSTEASTVNDARCWNIGSSGDYSTAVDCDFINTSLTGATAVGVVQTAGQVVRLYGCRIMGGGGLTGIRAMNDTVAIGCVFDNLDAGFDNVSAVTSTPIVVGCSFNNITTDCIRHIVATGTKLIAYNVAWGADRFYEQGTATEVAVMMGNAAGNITQSDLNAGDWAEPSRIALTADPFVDAANGDFRLNSAAGGGALVRAQGIFW